MQTKEALGAVFFDLAKEKVLLLRRTPLRTFNPNKMDIMGGDIGEGETPEDTLVRDVHEKLKIKNLSFLSRGAIFVQEENVTLHRHIFECSGDYSQLVVDSAKYSNHVWRQIGEIDANELTIGARSVLQYLGLLNDTPSH